MRYGSRVGLTHERLRIGEWLFARYGVSFVFAARFLPFVRNLAALLAGANGMPAHRFMPQAVSRRCSGSWAMAWDRRVCGRPLLDLALTAAIVLGLVVVRMIAAVPLLVLRYEKGLLEKSDQPRTPLQPPT